ncbi:MAG TPA: SPFH domain-containing protein, partial [Ignavibacteriaceae bacterium]
VSEKKSWKLNGFIALFIILILVVIDVNFFISGVKLNDPSYLWYFFPLTFIIIVSLAGLITVQPNDSRVIIFFGNYSGTVRDTGFWWINPFTIKRKVTLRIRNFNSDKIKVNDLRGNPIEIAAVIVWRVFDTSRAVFDVDNYEEFVAIQSETAIRSLTSEYPYDGDEDKASLRGSPQEVAENLKQQVQSRLEIAGVEVVEARISHLAYAQEIAQAMLRRQQAEAIVAARQKIVEGAVGMVESALQALSRQNIVQLDEDKKATMVNNLMVALVSDREAQPVINTGTLYQ